MCSSQKIVNEFRRDSTYINFLWLYIYLKDRPWTMLEYHKVSEYVVCIKVVNSTSGNEYKLCACVFELVLLTKSYQEPQKNSWSREDNQQTSLPFDKIHRHLSSFPRHKDTRPFDFVPSSKSLHVFDVEANGIIKISILKW